MIASGSVSRSMRTLLRLAVAEGMVILVLSAAAGYLYTGLAGNGCFGLHPGGRWPVPGKSRHSLRSPLKKRNGCRGIRR